MTRAGPAAWLIAGMLAGCATGPSAPPAEPVARAPVAAAPGESLTGTRWVGVVAGEPDPRILPRLEFVSATRVTGYTGCNMLNGAWRLEAGAIRVGPLVTTKRACVGPEMDTERRLLAALGGTVQRIGERLVFTGAGGDRFEFTPAAAS